MRICMKPGRNSFDWSQARAFLATAETGSFSAAARQLGLTQPTLGRQVAALEAELGVVLLERGGRSPVLTDAGIEILEHVRSMAEAAEHVSLAASGQSQSIEGRVCITSSDLMAAYVLPPILDQLREEAPGIEIEIVASSAMQDLRKREADIAIRHVRPEQPDLIAKLAMETTAHLYASTAFLDRHGRPETAEEVSALPFVGVDQPERLLPHLNATGLSLTRSSFRYHTESGSVMWELVKQGLGVTVMTREMADMTQGIEMVWPEFGPIPIPIWLVTHRELRSSRRIRLVFERLAEGLKRLERQKHST